MALVGNPNSRKNDAVQPYDGQQPICRQLARVTVEKKEGSVKQAEELGCALHWSIFRVFILCRHIPWRKLLRGIM